MSINSVLCNLHIKRSLEQRENPSKIIQMVILLIISNLGRLVLFRIICRTQICRLCLKARSQQFSNKRMLESAQQTKKIDLNYYVINHQWFRVTYVILYKKLADHAYKDTSWLPSKIFKAFLQAFNGTFRWISLNRVIYRISIDHAQIN